MEQGPELREQTEKQSKKSRKIVLWIILCVVLLALGMAAYYAHTILNRPQALFEQVVSVTSTPAAAATPVFDIEQYLPTEEPGSTPILAFIASITAPPRTEATEEGSHIEETPAPPEPAETPAPEAETTVTPAEPTEAAATAEPAGSTQTPAETRTETTKADALEEGLSGIVNIALFGIDAYEDGSTSSGLMAHTDANMIVAVNFDTKEVSLISIARDVFTDVPGYSGFYKFNGIFNVGGGLDDPKAGLALSCQAAEIWLGGVSVPYYYGVDFQALIDIVDALGGIDYDNELPIQTEDGTYIHTGMQHMDGEAVLAYLRARKTIGGLDYMRTTRQRKMMVALFKKIKNEGQLSLIPEILKILGDDVYTNTTITQTAALASFARNIDPANIHTYSIHGQMWSQYDWRFSFIDQQERIDILREVYGIEAEPLGVSSLVYERFLHTSGFLAIQHINNAKILFNAIHDAVAVTEMTEEQKQLYAACWKDLADLQTVFDLASDWHKAHYDENAELSAAEQQERYAYNQALPILEEQLRKSGNALNEAFGSPVRLAWNKEIEQWWYEDGSVINEVYVNFH